MSFIDRIRKLCRICGNMGSINIFGSLGQSLDISEKINTLLPIYITVNDHFSTVLCMVCVRRIILMGQIVEKGNHTNKLMIKLHEKKINTFQERMLKLCRICGNHGLLDIFKENSENSVCLADKINSFLTLQVSLKDDLSLKICQNCTDQVEDVYSLFEFCQNTTNLMMTIVGNITEDNKNTEHYSTLEINKTFQGDMNLENNEVLLSDNSNKENEFENVDGDQGIISNTFVRHAYFIDSNETQCLRCTNTFTSGTDLRHHILLSHNLKELDCHHCFRRCANISEFENHVKLHFPSSCSFYPCDLCSIGFNTLGNLVRHIKTHKSPRTIEWALAYNLPENSTSFKCQYCNKIYTLETSKRIHERTHFTSLICEICGKQLPNKSQLYVHQRQHTGERPYECTNCGSTFKCLSTLRQHEVVHFEKKYKCEVCLRKFSRPEKVRIHMRVHTGEKPYHCFKCHKQYQQKNDLNRHMKKKHEHEQVKMQNFRF